MALSGNPVGFACLGPQAEDWTLLATYFYKHSVILILSKCCLFFLSLFLFFSFFFLVGWWVFLESIGSPPTGLSCVHPGRHGPPLGSCPCSHPGGTSFSLSNVPSTRTPTRAVFLNCLALWCLFFGSRLHFPFIFIYLVTEL